jgi:dihydropyrimidinase
MTSLLVKGGTVVREAGPVQADVMVQDGRIAEVRPDIAGADEVLDARGLLVLPGVVDPHTHLRLDSGTVRTVDDFQSGSLSAAAGGVTTYIDFAAQQPGQTFPQVVQARRSDVDGRSHVDYSTHLSINTLYDGWERDLERVVTAGVSSAKVYTTYRGTVFYVDDWTWYRLMERSGEAGFLVQVHAENDDILEGRKRELLREGKTSLRYHATARPAVAEAEAVSRGLVFSRATGSPVYFVHLSNPLSVDLVREARGLGVQAFAETCPHFLALDDSVYAGEAPERYVMTPPIRDASMREELWRRLERGQIDALGSDHCGYALSQRQGVDDFSQVSPGIPGVETSLLLMHTLGVVTGRIGLADLVRMLSGKPSRIFGLWPRKGDLAPGFDADIVLFDPEPERVLGAGELHSAAGFSPYEGLTVKGRVLTTLCRGKVVWDRGGAPAGPGWGRFVPCDPFSAEVAEA